MQLASVNLVVGKELDSGHIAELPGGNICLYRYNPKDGFQMAVLLRENIEILLEQHGENMKLVLRVSGDPAVNSCSVILDAETVETAFGPWLDFWRPCICSANPDLVPETIFVGRARTTELRENELGIKDAVIISPALVGIGGGFLFVLSTQEKISIVDLQSWNLGDREFTALYLEQGVPRVFVVGNQLADEPRFWNELKSSLPQSTQENLPQVENLSDLGVFRQVEPDGSKRRVILQKRAEGLADWSDQNSPVFEFLWLLPYRTILASKNGQCMILELDPEQGSKLQALVNVPTGLIKVSDKESWVLFFSDDARYEPIRVSVRNSEVSYSETETYPLSSAVDLRVDPANDGMVRVTTKWRKGDDVVELRHVAPEQQAFAFWAWWDSEKARHEVAQLTTPGLYSQYNNARKHNFLLVAFGDLILLNRSLESGTPISQLCEKLDEVGSEKFADDKDLRDETVAKTMLLASSLQAIKQKYELLSAMAPYYWVQREAGWLSQAFGAESTKTVLTSERQRMVPALRRQIRTIQSDLYRSLGQIESGIRPLESIFSREEVQKHWSSRVRTYLPAATQIAIGIAGLYTGGTSFLITGPGMNLLAGAFATHGLGNILGIFQKDREAAAQVRRAAQSIFPWWQIFMKTLVISIFEAGEFMDSESALAMKRDRKLIDSLPEDKRPAAIKKVNAALRQRIVQERRDQFGEVVDGSGVRVMQIIQDIERASGEQMKTTVDSFVDTLVVTGKRSKRQMSELIDIDGDGIADGAVASADLDNDGIDETLVVSIDADGDGSPDALVIVSDTNADGVPDTEAFMADTNADGIMDFGQIGTDTDGDGVLDESVVIADQDGDGVPDVFASTDSSGSVWSDLEQASIPDESPTFASASVGESEYSSDAEIEAYIEIHGTPSEDLALWDQQDDLNSCAVATTGMLLRTEGVDVDEPVIAAIFESREIYDPDIGTDPAMIPDVINEMAIRGNLDFHAVEFHGFTPDSLEEMLDDGVRPLVGVDSSELYDNNNRMLNEMGLIPDTGHAVLVTGIVENGEGKFVVINDPGGAGGAGQMIPMDTFLNASADFGNTAVALVDGSPSEIHSEAHVGGSKWGKMALVGLSLGALGMMRSRASEPKNEPNEKR